MVEKKEPRRPRGTSAWGEFGVTKTVATELILTAQKEQRHKSERLRALRLAKQENSGDWVEK
ncbi:hypothetical protein P6U16_12985 [Rhizobium sp. 32-5/1]|uniref:hypothetical protein n=1 Tax=Rhizobium sp. 32-5/1 TaxID=3019602 RepID=UPI00240D3ECF|nr:hypothetical protein [Rhizobium sp. 32-5/1]WEZ82114.1 hypothetical protein P6U16_12985 [Rhizobium sp. 32-5/1]